MPSLLIGLSLLLLCFVTQGTFLTVEVTEHMLYTRFTEHGLREFFSSIPPLRKNYHALARLLESKKFLFKSYYTASATLEELDLIKRNYKLFPMLHLLQICRLQETDYGREWLLNNLNKFTTTDLNLGLIKPNLFTIKEQRAILTFALKHQRPFTWKHDFCTIFPDLSVFDYEWLWLYLDPFCFHSLPKERHLEVTQILQKRTKNNANLTAILFLIRARVPIHWKNVNFKHSKVINLLKSYQEAIFRPNYDRIWGLYKLLMPHFKNFSLGEYPDALSHIWLFSANYGSNDVARIHKEIVEFMNANRPSSINCYLLKSICKGLHRMNKHRDFKFKMPLTWNKQLLDKHINYIPKTCLPHRLRLQEWRKTALKLTFSKSSEFNYDTDDIYSNATIDGMLIVDYYTAKLNNLTNIGYLKLDPTLKFDCNRVNHKSLVSGIWIAKIYQFAINEMPLPLLSEELKRAIFIDECTNRACRRKRLKELADTVCLNPSSLPFAAAKTIADFTRKALNHFGIAFYYRPQDDFTIFNE